MSIKIKEIKRETIMNVYHKLKSFDEIQTTMHRASPDLGFLTTTVKQIKFIYLKSKKKTQLYF
jgi:hypothetical protein